MQNTEQKTTVLVVPVTTSSGTANIYNAPVDVRVRALPVKVFEKEFSPSSKYFPDREATVMKEIFIEDGRRKVPREDGEYREVKAPTQVDSDTLLDTKQVCDVEVDICDSALFLEDLDYVEPLPEFPGPYDPERARVLYRRACAKLGLIPCSLFLRSLNTGRVNASHQGLGPLDARAIALSLITTLTVTELHLSGNKLGPSGMECMAKLIHDNETIKVLGISDNQLGQRGGMILAACILTNDSIQQINAAGNELDDGVCQYLAEALKVNQQIRQLDLSRNEIGSKGLKMIAQALEVNRFIGHLDVSYNKVRCEGLKCWGYRGIQNMLKINRTLLHLCLAWNGIDTDAAKLLGNGLNENNTLSVLDLTGCRLNAAGIINLIMCGKNNKNLKSLLITDNPITNADLILIVKTIYTLPDSTLSFIDAGSVTVSRDFLDLVAEVSKARPGFVVTYRGTFSQKDMSRNMLAMMDLTGGDPLEAMIKYTKTRNLRLVDLFARIDTDKSGSVTRQELIHGVAEMGIPLSIKQMDRLVAKLDKDGDGEIDFGELLDGYKKLMRRLHKMGIVARTALRQDEGYFPAVQPGSAGRAPAAGGRKDSGTPRKVSGASKWSVDSKGQPIPPPIQEAETMRTEDKPVGIGDYLTAEFGDPDAPSTSMHVLKDGPEEEEASQELLMVLDVDNLADVSTSAQDQADKANAADTSLL